MRQLPVCSEENSQVIPPMWVNGKISAERSDPTRPRHWLMPRATAAIDASVWRAPFGSAVVPDV